MKAEWKGGITIVDTSGRITRLRIFLLGNEEQCTEQADEARRFVEALWAMGIAATLLQWVKMMTNEEPADELDKLAKQLKEARDRLQYFDDQQLRL